MLVGSCASVIIRILYSSNMVTNAFIAFQYVKKKKGGEEKI